jgi:hypothetical protein
MEGTVFLSALVARLGFRADDVGWRGLGAEDLFKRLVARSGLSRETPRGAIVAGGRNQHAVTIPITASFLSNHYCPVNL